MQGQRIRVGAKGVWRLIKDARSSKWTNEKEALKSALQKKVWPLPTVS